MFKLNFELTSYFLYINGLDLVLKYQESMLINYFLRIIFFILKLQIIQNLLNYNSIVNYNYNFHMTFN